MKFSELLKKLSASITQHSLNTAESTDLELRGIDAIDRAKEGMLSYIEGPKFAAYVEKTTASALILPIDETLQTQATQRGIAWLSTPQPRLVFAEAIGLFYQPFRPTPSIHPSAIIDPNTTIGDQVYIGPHVVIQSGVTLGDGVCIHPNVTIYPEVQIGSRSILHANCTLHERSQIGADCVIHSGAVIGAEGFGFVPTAEGWFKMQQSGVTVLEDGVEVGCNSTVDRPAVGETRIQKNTKLDNLVHIGHGCQVGENCAFAAQVGLAGGVVVGNQVILAGQVGVANQAKIGDKAIATAQAGIHSSVKAGEIVSDSPAIPNKLYLKISAIRKRLPEIYKTIKELQRQLNDHQ
ncbi:UDP-3-O-(3-hydroxymyristoyl)glucosamine N-acyltransferase [Lyngbya sp. PCC 8106]|uniref:UDP-3-O-(3-hydroxymyristoyl)glucosamine N-acyltransferase n=1 Tax=Lyngbya sp. (strain PCC 8106) TaxID=313612 RepID=UPI0000EAB253|nr:UDP-3-O-(3-hydroxymyristoyl)glucosamine N-acyltransferase [Lyngbya sp. PCC 8106]EAW39290.1 UDP-3-O-[3-hydroxymyristoyl] glucosamine N-acyltransferase [Lyngbya sp. PCC 8106]